MKTKLEMAHDYAMKHIQEGWDINYDVLVVDAWQYADAMQAEADKRENKTRPEVLMAVQQTFINGIEQPRYAASMGDQKRTPKVSRFERSDAVKEVLNRAENMGLIKPKAIDEWQPDWSQAPDVATYWTMRQDGECLWWKGKPLFDGSCFYDAVGICHTVGYAPSFGYHSDWRNSLRKRPQ